MRVKVSFYSYFKDLAGCSETMETVPDGTTVAGLLDLIPIRFARLEAMRKSMLVAVGVEYAGRDYVIKDGEQISLFPPVQGG